ncbi:MAG: hypothetical protein QXD23_03405 [Candidatus Micrarchaeaceae archaeon]
MRNKTITAILCDTGVNQKKKILIKQTTKSTTICETEYYCDDFYLLDIDDNLYKINLVESGTLTDEFYVNRIVGFEFQQ